MPASITERSCSSLAMTRAMRLKPRFTSRISLVSVCSLSCESYSPSRSRLAATESSISGRLIKPATTAEASRVAPSSKASQPPRGVGTWADGSFMARSQ